MAELGRAGDLSGVTQEDMEQTGSWKALLDGDYLFEITETDYTANSKGTGMNLMLKYQCIEPGRTRSRWREYLALENPNGDTVRIARAKLKQLALAVGHPTPDHVKRSEDLESIPFKAKVSREPEPDPRYGDVDGYRNRIVAHFPAGASRRAEPAYDEKNPPPPTDADDIPF